MAVGAAYQRPLRTHPMIGDSDAARKLREHGDIGILAVNTIEAVLRAVEQEARRELFVLCARIEESWGRWNVFQRREEMIEIDGLIRALGEAARDAHPEKLRAFDHVALCWVL